MVTLHKSKLYSVVTFSFMFLFILNSFAKSDTSSEERKYHVKNTIENIDTDLRNFTFTLHKDWSYSLIKKQKEIDCFGLGSVFTRILNSFFKQKENNTSQLNTHFYMSSRKQPNRVFVCTGKQFGLEWTDFDIRRKTVIIVHGFLSNSSEDWIHDMEKAFLLWDDVNIIVVDWSAVSNTWNYYKAAVNTRIVGSYIAKLFEHIANSTIDSQGPPENEWGKLHFVGHSLGAHICSVAANAMRKLPNKWKVERITGLDPAQPCFKNFESTILLNRNDADFVDVIHTNGDLWSDLGLGMPQPIGNVDFYPNGGKAQPGCANAKSFHVPLPTSVINQAICSHRRSYAYFTESILVSVQHNCSFWAHHSDLTFRHILTIIDEQCSPETCSEMGINSINHPQRGTFFCLTSQLTPYCNVQESDKKEVLNLLRQNLQNEIDD